MKAAKKMDVEYQKFVIGMTPEESLSASQNEVSEYVKGYDSDPMKPKWLLSPITDNQWEIKLDKAIVEINFDVEFISSEGNAEKLLSKEHAKLLNVFKCWLLVQSSPLHNGFQKCSAEQVSKKLRYTLYLIDYLLLNSRVIKLEKHFLLWDKDLVIAILKRLFDNNSFASGVYEAQSRLNNYIASNLTKYSDEALRNSFDRLICQFELPDEFVNSCSTEQIMTLGFLKLENVIEGSSKSNRRGLVKRSYLRNILFSNTLYGHRIKILTLDEDIIFETSEKVSDSEFLQHPLNKRYDIGISEKYFAEIRQCFYCLADINSFGKFIGLPTAEIEFSIFEKIKLKTLLETALKGPGRTPTIGAGVILTQIRNAFEFVYEHGDLLLEAAERMLVASVNEIKETSLKEFVNYGYKKYLTDDLLKLGVEVIGYDSLTKERFLKRRQNKDLFFLYNVLQGSLQIILGSTMARRMGDFVDLDPFESITPVGIDPERSQEQDFNLIFDNRKSGIAFGGEIVREQKSRPILNSVAAIVYKWQKFNLRLSEKKLLKNLNDVGLFTSLSSYTVSVKEGNTESFVYNLDAFCDYFETDTYVDEKGVTRRLYIRQHQLRRFFAMVFYWAYGYEASEVLRYFLAHTDISHLERYVNEETSGEVLRGVQSERIIDGIRNQDIIKIDQLEIIIRNKFGLNSIEYTTYEEIRQDVDDEIIKLEQTHEHVNPQRYENYEVLLGSLDELLLDGTIELKAEYAKVKDKHGHKHEIMDLVLKYE